MKLTLSALVLCLGFLSQTASASTNALAFYDLMGKAGIPDDGALGKLVREVPAIECQKKVDAGVASYACFFHQDGIKDITLNNNDSRAVFGFVALFSDISCDAPGGCWVFAEDVACSQVNAGNWEPGKAPAPRDRTHCRMKVSKTL